MPMKLNDFTVFEFFLTAGEFAISATGQVSTTVIFDRETGADNYQLQIVVKDGGVSSLSTTTTLTVTITGV